MKTLNLTQGSPEWLAHRRTTRNASDASVMMGAFPTFSRRELVRLRAVGLEREFSDYVQERILDKGHAVEPALRALAESIIGDDLYPVTGLSDDGYLGASFDGVTIDEETILEAKQWSSTKAEIIGRGEIPPQDYWQVVQQFDVCESATRCLYLVGDGSEAGTAKLWIERSQVEADLPKLRAGWAQFDADVAAYVPEPVKAGVVAAPVAGFGTLSLRVEGRVLASNLDAFRTDAEAFIERLPRPADLQSDQDFADAEAAVKACDEAESRIKSAREAALAQMADVDSLLRTAESISQIIRAARLALEKAVKAEKENRKAEIVNLARAAYDAHVAALRAETNNVWLQLPPPDFAGAIKGKRTLSSMKDAVDGVLAQGKIAASESARHIRAALACLSEETEGHKHLFPDYQSFIGKPVDDIRALVRGRIAEHKAREEAKLEAERERIRAEEAARLEREQREQREREEADRQAAAEAEAAGKPEPAAATTPAGPAAAATAPTAATGAAVAQMPAPSTARVKLGDINARIAPLSITADGLASLGFQPVGTERAAKLYAEDDFPRICQAIIDLLALAGIKSHRDAA